MKIPGTLAALALLAATSLAPDGAKAEETTAKKDAATEVIDTIADVTRYDAALGDTPIKDAEPKKPAKKTTDADKAKDEATKPAKADAGDKTKTNTVETATDDAGKGTVTPVKAGSADSPIIVKEETARAIAEGREVDARSLDADGATATPVVAQPASMRINGIKPAVILPGEATNGHTTNGHHPTVRKAAQKAAEDTGAKIIDIQRRSRSKQRLPVVVRGVIPDDDEDTAPAPEALTPKSGWRMTGGRNFWFYNSEEGLLIGCRLVGTAKVGDNKRVKCSRPRLAPDFH